MPIIWSEKYSVGIEEIDEQHKKLVQLINHLEVQCAMGPGAKGLTTKFKKIFSDLVNYTVLHFSTEEVLMRMFEYDGFEAHKRSHQMFIDMIEQKLDFISNFTALPEDELTDDIKQQIIKQSKEMLEFLQNWLINHIQKTDTQYTEFFNKLQKKARSSGGWLSFLK